MPAFLVPEADIRNKAQQDGVSHFATGIAVVRDHKILVVRRVAHDFLGGLYELPGGGLDDGESFEQGAARELKEETGLTVRHLHGMFNGFDYQTPHKPKVRQINFLVEVEAGDVVLEPNEHDNFRWISAADISSLHTSNEMEQCLRDALRAAALM